MCFRLLFTGVEMDILWNLMFKLECLICKQLKDTFLVTYMCLIPIAIFFKLYLHTAQLVAPVVRFSSSLHSSVLIQIISITLYPILMYIVAQFEVHVHVHFLLCVNCYVCSSLLPGLRKMHLHNVRGLSSESMNVQYFTLHIR